MKYRRPQTFDAAVEQLKACSGFSVTGRQLQLQVAVTRLFELNWYEDAMKPLYHSNAVVQLVMNSIVPMIQELILEKSVFDEAVDKADKVKVAKYHNEYDALLQKMKEVAPLRKQRSVTAEFEAMAHAMELYANDEDIQSSLRAIFGVMKSARTAFRLVFVRINDALENHSEILKSDDIPFEALQL